jgi:hypothetical protein
MHPSGGSGRIQSEKSLGRRRVTPVVVLLTIPKRLRVHTRFDRKLLGKLCAAAWTCIQAEVRAEGAGRGDSHQL